jgi:hypothetical protein
MFLSIETQVIIAALTLLCGAASYVGFCLGTAKAIDYARTRPKHKRDWLSTLEMVACPTNHRLWKAANDGGFVVPPEFNSEILRHVEMNRPQRCARACPACGSIGFKASWSKLKKLSETPAQCCHCGVWFRPYGDGKEVPVTRNKSGICDRVADRTDDRPALNREAWMREAVGAMSLVVSRHDDKSLSPPGRSSGSIERLRNLLADYEHVGKTISSDERDCTESCHQVERETLGPIQHLNNRTAFKKLQAIAMGASNYDSRTWCKALAQLSNAHREENIDPCPECGVKSSRNFNSKTSVYSCPNCEHRWMWLDDELRRRLNFEKSETVISDTPTSGDASGINGKGLYWIEWESGSTSAAVVYLDLSGREWIATTEWETPAPLEGQRSSMKRVTAIKPGRSGHSIPFAHYANSYASYTHPKWPMKWMPSQYSIGADPAFGKSMTMASVFAVKAGRMPERNELELMASLGVHAVEVMRRNGHLEPHHLKDVMTAAGLTPCLMSEDRDALLTTANDTVRNTPATADELGRAMVVIGEAKKYGLNPFAKGVTHVEHTLTFAPALVKQMLGGQWPHADGFAWEQVDHFQLEDGVLEPYGGPSESDILPGPGLVLLPNTVAASVHGMTPEQVRQVSFAQDVLGSIAWRDCHGCDYDGEDGTKDCHCDVCQAKEVLRRLDDLVRVNQRTLHPSRLKSTPERIYFEQWIKEHERQNLLAMLLVPEDRHGKIPENRSAQISPRDVTVAATLIQWLGTNCGRDFIDRCERMIAEEDQQLGKARVRPMNGGKIHGPDWRPGQIAEGIAKQWISIERHPEAVRGLTRSIVNLIDHLETDAQRVLAFLERSDVHVGLGADNVDHKFLRCPKCQAVRELKDHHECYCCGECQYSGKAAEFERTNCVPEIVVHDLRWKFEGRAANVVHAAVAAIKAEAKAGEQKS